MDEIITLIRAKPFERFRLHLADGRSLQVDDPDFMARAPSGREVTIAVQGGGFERVRMDAVERVEVVDFEAG